MTESKQLYRNIETDTLYEKIREVLSADAKNRYVLYCPHAPGCDVEWYVTSMGQWEEEFELDTSDK